MQWTATLGYKVYILLLKIKKKGLLEFEEIDSLVLKLSC